MGRCVFPHLAACLIEPHAAMAQLQDLDIEPQLTPFIRANSSIPFNRRFANPLHARRMAAHGSDQARGPVLAPAHWPPQWPAAAQTGFRRHLWLRAHRFVIRLTQTPVQPG